MFADELQELPIPPAVKSDRRAVELARIWAANGKQHVTLSADAWDDPAAWGIMLVDLARHVADFYRQEKGRDIEEVLARIRMGFEAEWDGPTGDAKGQSS